MRIPKPTLSNFWALAGITIGAVAARMHWLAEQLTDYQRGCLIKQYLALGYQKRAVRMMMQARGL